MRRKREPFWPEEYRPVLGWTQYLVFAVVVAGPVAVAVLLMLSR